MTMTTTALRMAFLAAAGAAACAWAPHAAADDTVQADLGGQADVGAGQQWTVTALQPSADVIGYQPAGALWEATATATPAGGGVPVVPGFTARSGGGDSYPVLWAVPTPAGINPSALPAGGSATGRLYFDVTGPTPDRVAYTRDGQDTAIWVQPPPPAAGAASWPAGTLGYTPPATPRITPLPAQVAPQTPGAAGQAGVPAAPPAAASTGTPLSVTPGSAGTPSPAAAGSAGTPLPATGSAGTPATAGQATTPPAAATPAPTPSTPAPAGTPTPTTPSASPSTVTPAPNSGSSGTPLTAPTTTPVPAAGG